MSCTRSLHTTRHYGQKTCTAAVCCCYLLTVSCHLVFQTKSEVYRPPRLVTSVFWSWLGTYTSAAAHALSAPLALMQSTESLALATFGVCWCKVATLGQLSLLPGLPRWLPVGWPACHGESLPRPRFSARLALLRAQRTGLAQDCLLVYRTQHCDCVQGSTSVQCKTAAAWIPCGLR